MQNEKQSTGKLNPLAIAVTFTGVFLFATKAIIAKLAYQEGVNATTILMLRMLFALPFYAVILFWRSNWTVLKSITFNDHLKIISLGIVGYYISSLLDFLGLEYITANLERLILYVYPTLVVIISGIFMRKKISSPQVIAILITYFGVFLTFFENVNIPNSDRTFLGVSLVFGSALTYAIYLVGSTELLKRVGTWAFTSYSMVVSSICVLIHAAFGEVTPFAQIPLKVYSYAITMSICSTLLPSFMITYALTHMGATKVSIIGNIGPIFTIFLSYFVLNETLTGFQIIGGIIIIMGVFYISKKK